MGWRDHLLVKRARLFLTFLGSRAFGRRVPIVAYLLITDRCNMRCRYCFVDCTQRREELATDDWLGLIDDLHARGGRMVCFMGGEPLIHKDIDRLVDRVKRHGMLCDMTTNGVLVPRKLETVKKVDSLMVSLDGTREATDANRGEGAFDHAMEAIRIAREAGVVVRVNAVMTKQSVGSVEFLLDLADTYDLWVTFSITAEFPESEEALAEEICLTREEIVDLYTRLRGFKERNRRVLFSMPTLEYVIGYPLPYDRIVMRDDADHRDYYTRPCPFGRTMFYVDANGDVYPCAALWNAAFFSPKNLREVGFDAAWRHAGDLPCACCFCPGVPEWNRITSLEGFADGVRVTLKQAFARASS